MHSDDLEEALLTFKPNVCKKHYASISLTSNSKAWQWSKRPSFENDALQLWYAGPGGWQGPYFTVTPNGSVGIGTVKTADAGRKK